MIRYFSTKTTVTHQACDTIPPSYGFSSEIVILPTPGNFQRGGSTYRYQPLLPYGCLRQCNILRTVPSSPQYRNVTRSWGRYLSCSIPNKTAPLSFCVEEEEKSYCWGRAGGGDELALGVKMGVGWGTPYFARLSHSPEMAYAGDNLEGFIFRKIYGEIYHTKEF